MSYYAQGGQNIPAQGTPEQAGNPTLARGIAAAQSEYAANQLQGFQDQLGRLKRATINRDATQPGRMHYDIVHAETVKFAERIATITGQPQQVPRYLPAPNVAVEYETVNVPPYDLGLYEERKDQRNLPAGSIQPNFADVESKEHQDWLTAQGTAPVDTAGMSPAEAGKAKRKRAGEPS